ncbi:MAG: PASTA domain-containing protein, partial [Bulleidia sp.]
PVKKKKPETDLDETVHMEEPKKLKTFSDELNDNSDFDEKEAYGDPDSPDSFAEEERVKIEKPKRHLSAGGKILIAVAAAAVAFLVYWFGFAPHIVMQDFVGKDLNSVSTWAKQNKMDAGVVATATPEYSMDVDKDLILSQSVSAGTKIRKDTQVTFTLSLGPDPDEQISFPDLKNMTQSEISDWISENKLLKTKVTTQYSTTVESGAVISYDLKNADESSFTRGTTLNIICSKGPAPAGQVTVESWVNKEFTGASGWAVSKKLNVNKQETYSDKVDSGLVISQSPEAGQSLDEGGTITFVVSKGKGVTVPNLVGYTKEQLDAWTADKNNDVTVVTKSIYNDAPAGSVISQSISAGTVVDSGTVLELTVSLYLPILETNSRQWLGKDYLELKAWVDDVNSKGANIQAGEYGADYQPTTSDEYPTPGQIVKYSCSYGTSDAGNGCERPLSLNARIAYQVSTGPSTVATPTPTVTAAPAAVHALSTSDLSDLNAITSFCENNHMSCSYTATQDTSAPAVSVSLNGTTHATGDQFSEVVPEGTSITVTYRSDVSTAAATPSSGS